MQVGKGWSFDVSGDEGIYLNNRMILCLLLKCKCSSQKCLLESIDQMIGYSNMLPIILLEFYIHLIYSKFISIVKWLIYLKNWYFIVYWGSKKSGMRRQFCCKCGYKNVIIKSFRVHIWSWQSHYSNHIFNINLILKAKSLWCQNNNKKFRI